MQVLDPSELRITQGVAVILILVCAAFLWARPSQAEELIGAATAVEGDIIEIDGQCIRLFGVDAPKHEQTCIDKAGEAYRCGEQATRALDNLVRGKIVRCERRNTDNAGRLISVCSVGKLDIGARMVDEGYAISSAHYPNRYGRNELQAQARKKGLWAGTFETPWDYTKRMRRANVPVASGGDCAIKARGGGETLR